MKPLARLLRDRVKARIGVFAFDHATR